MGTTAQKLEYLNTTKGYIKDSINLTNANITNEPFRQYADILKNRLPEIVGDPSIIWNNYEHVTGSGTSITISTYKSIFEYSLNGDTTQSGTPTPDAPVPVQTVTGNQTITISDGTDSTVQYINLGKNLYNYTFNQSSSNRLTSTVFGVKPNTTYTFSTNASNIQVINYYKDKDKNNISNNNWATLNYTFTTPNNCYYIQQVLRKSDNADLTINDITNLQLEEGSTATSYAQYFEPIELCKIGEYQDRIYKSNGKWYLHKEIGKVVLDGSENGWHNEGGQAPFAIYLNILRDNNVSTLLCNYFKNSYWNDSWSGYTSLVSPNSTSTAQAKIKFRYTSITSLDDFKTWLGTHNTSVYYVLDTATTEEINNYYLVSDLNNLELMTGSITITVSGDLPSPIDITAIKN